MLNKNTLFYFLIFIIIGLVIYLIYFTQTQGYSCMNNPLVYGVKNIKSSEPFYCRCSTLSSQQELLVTNNSSTWQLKLSFDNDYIIDQKV